MKTRICPVHREKITRKGLPLIQKLSALSGSVQTLISQPVLNPGLKMPMRFIYLPFFLFLHMVAITAVSQVPAKHKTYAVVVGIARYAAKGLQLKYANRDAEAFALYLQSNAGGAVPAAHIRLLTDSSATLAAIDDALSWLLETCEEGDLVYFYFAGHGDMENKTIYKLGFLLAYNTPKTNYINNAIRIEDLNNIANTLSVENKAKVVMITDACHSGDLAGNRFKCNQLVGEQLRTVKANEVRITSCAADQLSMEDEGWGGGRGVFSYYLIRGLNGLATQEKDSIVTLEGIRQYLDSSLANDPILKKEKHPQQPVIKGKADFKLATVDVNNIMLLKSEVQESWVTEQARMETEARQPSALMEFFMHDILEAFPEEAIDYDKFRGIPAQEIPLMFLQQVKELMYNNDTIGGMGVDYSAVKWQKLLLLDSLVKGNKVLLKRFRNKLTVYIQDKVQQIINLYVDGDEAELEKRRYYNSNSNGYGIYIKMIDLALQITDSSHQLYPVLLVDKHYFSGIVARISIPLVEDPAPLISKAWDEQMKALALEPNAAFIYNELGVLCLYREEFSKAEKYFTQASIIAPQWVLPVANLIAVYSFLKKDREADQLYHTAMELQPDFQGTYVNRALLYENQKNQLLAEELYRKSIQLNSRHFLPFERLGYVYMTTTNYAEADSFFFEADIRKRGYHFPNRASSIALPKTIMVDNPMYTCDFDTLAIAKTDVMGYFDWGFLSYLQGNYAGAEEKFRKVIAIDSSNPLAFHYLGKLCYEQQRYQEADILFGYAVDHYLDSAALEEYAQVLDQQNLNSPDRDCLKNYFLARFYQRVEDHYFLAALYRQWNHFSEAEEQYRMIIRMDPDFMGGYYLLWNMLESIARFDDAEELIRQYRSVDRVQGEREMNDFYKRMMARFPDEGYWFYKAGSFLYHLAADYPDNYYLDRKVFLPDEKIPSYINKKWVAQARANLRHAVQPVYVPGTNEQYIKAKLIQFPRTEGIAYLVKADSLLLFEDDLLADINYKIGELYVWQGLPELASAHYQKSVDLQPGNAGTRMKLADSYNITYHFSAAMEQLDTLDNRKEINFTHQVLLAKYKIHTGQFAKAATLLANAKSAHPFYIPAITDLSGRQHLLAGELREALPYYQAYWDQDKKDCQTQYTIARIYAKTGKSKQAWTWLEAAIHNGFLYGYVLDVDPFWEKFRGTVKWKRMMTSYRLSWKNYAKTETQD
ncbi:MAG: hypothetical protein GC171_11375 [Terrimonas sp.]|nr:hypothetical protein [Terrimonas sp.]